jgi:ubiquinone/menaquinone biosynthesis C-methylase UbiE
MPNMLSNHSSKGREACNQQLARHTRVLKWLDRNIGRGPYRWVMRLDPKREYTQWIYTRFVGGLLKPEMRWLDAGCGHEVFKASLNSERELIGKVQFAVGCDVGIDALRNHRSLNRRLCARLEELPFPDGTFDLVTLNMVAEHLEQPEVTFGEFARVLREGGLLVVHTPNSNSYPVVLGRILKWLLPKTVIDRLIRFFDHREPDDVFPTFYRANTKKRLDAMLRCAGMVKKEFLLLPDVALFHFFAPLGLPEVLITRFFFWLGWREAFADVILASYRSTRRDRSAGGIDQERDAAGAGAR